ncbi:helix-turn-helix transcriptional regulator [Barnesiella intestinihominis]|uniref:helix-turn-helix transcriptional regulator n=1 Tax=Barnesiella intestinihominis TaxID=487174 RepID=UPI003967D6A5
MDIKQNDKVENRLKAVLADKKKTCRWLANEIGRNENTVSRWCSNKVQPSLDQLREIADILDVDIRTLIRSNKEVAE